MWQVMTEAYLRAFNRAQFVENINGVQIWNLNDCYYIFLDEKFEVIWSQMSHDLDLIRKETRYVMD